RPRAERRAVARGAVHLARRLARIRACRAHERGARDRARDARGGTPSWLTSADRTPSRLRSAGRTPSRLRSARRRLSWLRSARRARLETSVVDPAAAPVSRRVSLRDALLNIEDVSGVLCWGLTCYSTDS